MDSAVPDTEGCTTGMDESEPEPEPEPDGESGLGVESVSDTIVSDGVSTTGMVDGPAALI